MKKLASAMLGLLLLGLWLPRVANTEVDWLGRLTLLGGAERESRKVGDHLGQGGHGFGLLEALGVIPITPFFGLQMNLNWQPTGDATPRVGGHIAPFFDFGAGKVGAFLIDQFRMYPPKGDHNREKNFLWVGPSVALYDLFGLLPKTNTDIWLKVPVKSVNRTCVVGCDENHKQFIPVGQLRAAVNFFPPFLWKDNVELTLGVHITGIAGVGKQHVGSGVGPVWGAAFMPIPNVEVQLVKASYDNHNRYRVTSGFQYYIDRGTAGGPSSLLQLRRKYMEPTNLPGSVSSYSTEP